MILMSTLTVSPEYGALLKRVPPRVIRTEKENEAYTEVLYELDQRSKRLTAAEKELTELLTLLIEDYEEKRYRLPRAKPVAWNFWRASSRESARTEKMTRRSVRPMK